jgi:hypothetical protein
MDASAQGRPTQAAPHQQASLIRPEQVSRLPQLTPVQKQQYEGLVRKCWEALNSLPQGEQKYNEAYQHLVRTSQTLMQGMKNYQQAAKQRHMQQQQQQQQAAQAAQQQQQAQAQAQAQAGVPGQQQSQQPQNNSVQFTQLMPDIQNKVNDQSFYYPPAMIEGTRQAEDWLREAKARFGQALQRLQVARTKKAEFQRQAQQMEVFNSKLAQCSKAITESQTFMEKFKAQQNEFRNAQPSQQFQKQQAQAETQDHSGGQGGSMANLQPGVGPGQGPQAHAISSAVSAAASARNQQQAQVAQQGAGPTQPGQAGSPVNPNAASGPTPAQGVTPIKTEVTNASGSQSTAHGEAPLSAGPRPSSHSGLPQSALQQHPSSSSIHAHPLSASINGSKPVTAQAITKNLQVSEPKQVQMPAARPTLNGGAGVGAPGQLGQPALATLPGYVLESSEDGRLLSKKKLNELVREVVGPGKEGVEGEESLTAEAEEVRSRSILGLCAY